jgi:hypothetical protein
MQKSLIHFFADNFFMSLFATFFSRFEIDIKFCVFEKYNTFGSYLHFLQTLKLNAYERLKKRKINFATINGMGESSCLNCCTLMYSFHLQPVGKGGGAKYMRC